MFERMLKGSKIMNLMDGKAGETYTVKNINTDDEEMKSFLFRLGCYSGESITVLSKRKNGCIVSIKDGRYNLDNLLAGVVEI